MSEPIVLTDLGQLQSALDDAERQAAISDDAYRHAASRIVFKPALTSLPADPFSAEYRLAQLALYERISGRRYSPDYEATPFNCAHEIRQPYPYGTRSAATVGDSLIGYGFVIRNLPLRPTSRVLEVGSGYGSLTVHLAPMHVEMTCIDVDRNLLDFVAQRIAGLNHRVQFVQGDIHRFDSDRAYDVVLFHASFHHCHDHQLVLRKLPSLLANGGMVVFASEPIIETPSDLLPYPWGLRMDGLSLRDIRRFGWLELGFSRYYFFSLLQRLGWSYEERAIPGHPQTHLVIARRAG